MSVAIPVLEAVQKFLSFCSARNDSTNTIRAYNSDLLAFVQCIGHDTPVKEITRKRIRQYIFSVDSGVKDNTVKRKIAVLRSFSNWLFNERFVDINPAEGFTGPRVGNKLPDIPSEADMEKLLSGPIRSLCPERDQVILELLYSSGLRASEVAGVNLADFTAENTLLVHGKGKKDRLVPIGKFARRALGCWLPVRSSLLAKKRMQTKALLFSVGPHGSAERLDVRTIHRVVRLVALSKNLPPYHPHLLRHACAIHMHDHGAPIQAVAMMLGHAKLSTTQIYTRVSRARMLEVYRKAHPHGSLDSNTTSETKPQTAFDGLWDQARLRAS